MQRRKFGNVIVHRKIGLGRISYPCDAHILVVGMCETCALFMKNVVFCFVFLCNVGH